MGNLVEAYSSKPVIFVDQQGCEVITGIKICEPGDAVPIIIVDNSGNSL